MVSLVPSLRKALKTLNFNTTHWGGVKHLRNIYLNECFEDQCYEDVENLKTILEDNNIDQNDIIIYTFSRNRIFYDRNKTNQYNSKIDFFDGFS